MTYEYACPKCRRKTDFIRPVHERDNPAECPFCDAPKGAMRRVYNFSGLQVNANLLRDKSENKWGLGNSESEILATMKADEKSYNDHWDGKWKDEHAQRYGRDVPHETVSKEPVGSMLDVAQKMGITLG